ncbi:MAG: class I mannose-6-phosphate isomerase [Chloroflexota bacterium]|nr:class I mannose-6-phosphate isomerase [Chloroflexota bacterium]
MPKSPSPIQVTPSLDPKPWGGRRLADWGIDVPAGAAIGEAHLAAPGAIVASGVLAGLSLGELARRDPGAWIGARGLEATGGHHMFPLLIKLIAGETDLSIQVHPDNRAAAAAGLGTGKTEAYHVLSAAPEHDIYLGLAPGATMEALAAACRHADGSAANLLRRVPATPGMTILIPAGTVHALGAGITVYEIQQPSNTTFRLDDWGRVDDLGRTRQLHHDEGLAVVDIRLHPEPIAPVVIENDASSRALLVATRYFALERIVVNDVVTLAGVDSPQVVTVIAGNASLEAAGWDASISLGETVIVPSGLASRLTGAEDAVLLRGWVPDLERDVIGPARAMRATDEAIRQLGADLPRKSC